MISRAKAATARVFPEKRLFLRSDAETKFIRLSSGAQLLATVGTAAVLGWTIMATAILVMDSMGAGSLRDQAMREQRLYEARLNAISAERDARAQETTAAHSRFTAALEEVSAMQLRLFEAEQRRAELQRGLDVIQARLSDANTARDAAEARARALSTRLAAADAPDTAAPQLEEAHATLQFLTDALSGTAAERDAVAHASQSARDEVAELETEMALLAERNDRIFQQLEEAVSISLEPIDDMFRAAGLPADSILETVRRGYSGQGGPLTPLTLSTMGEEIGPDEMRANGILEQLDQLNLYRIAIEKTPFAEPVRGAFRYTSGFGTRRDPLNGGSRMHNGSDFAGAYGTPIYATADGEVVHAGWSSGFGRLVKIRHDFGIETWYAHQSRLRVNVGDRVSRGDRIGDMGNSGRSTGTHLHYEVRIGGKPVNPMKFIKAAKDVF